MITVFTTKTCSYCGVVKRYQDAKKVEYKTVDVTDDSKLRGELNKKTGYTTVPVITDGETYIAGWKPAELSKMISEVD